MKTARINDGLVGPCRSEEYSMRSTKLRSDCVHLFVYKLVIIAL